MEQEVCRSQKSPASRTCPMTGLESWAPFAMTCQPYPVE
ncbi:hypothetical protein HMPREF9130_0205 [Peptoniphilus sp. oral taxon 375 str. F0436]|nr:hypothetical protein HMPREF9130_0205 [Peptoniphilus sp. oral taxon 375 str. F0436]